MILKTDRRTKPLFVLAAVLVFAAMGLGVAPRCPTPDPKGFGLLEFGAREDSQAFESELGLGSNPLFTWAELEPSEGAYDWSPIDRALAAAHATGRKAAPRVYTNAGDFYQATPGWVYAAGAASYTIEQGHDTPQPVPTDAVFTVEFAAFLAALGARYDGHPDIEFFQTNAGMGAYGEMVWSLDGSSRPPGYSSEAQIETNREWLDRWRAAFPRTKLVLMQNFIGDGIAENVTAYAVDRGFFLQSNSPGQEDAAAAILRKHDDRTKIVLEIENRGCQASTGQAFDGLIDEVFGYGFAIDYLVICGETFDDAEGVLRAYDHLRK